MISVLLIVAHASATPSLQTPTLTQMAGYLIVPHERVDSRFNAGFSMYVSAWPLLDTYPGQEFQSGLFGTWMFPQFEGQAPKDHYTDIEGGLGWWRDTRYATETPKFIMGGVALNFSEWANGPGAGKGRNWNNPTGLYGVAQLSPWLLWPPDGLNLAQGTKGQLFGYGYLPLPLTDPKTRTAGVDVPTGNQCWTLFLNSANFKGPVAFFTPYFWSKASAHNPELAGKFLDSRPSEPNRAVQMETQHVPAMVGKDGAGNTYARIATTYFPGSLEEDLPLIHRSSAYAKDALWNEVQAWFNGGKVASGEIKSAASATHSFGKGGYATWKITLPGADHDKSPEVDLASYASPTAIDKVTFGYRWKPGLITPIDKGLVKLPEYYRLETGPNNKQRWVPISADAVPAETGLVAAKFPVPKRSKEPYVTPAEPGSTWKKPGPAAGPFVKGLPDGSKLTYYWYKFCNQPALQNADLTQEELQRIQGRVEKLHRSWTKNRNFLPVPTTGTLALVDPALLVTPPKGMSIGYVPIVTRQEPQNP